MKIDGKYSFEDRIIPVEKYQEFYGGSVIIFGYLETHKLATLLPKDVYQ